MEDWKERLKAEYAQTKERYEKLKAYKARLLLLWQLLRLESVAFYFQIPPCDLAV